MLSAAAAASHIVGRVPRMPAIDVPLEQALDHVLARNFVATVHMPPWDSSAMDGYALWSADVAPGGIVPAGTPVRLRVSGAVAAGDATPPPLAAGTAVRIATGAPVPAGADSVVRNEDTDCGTDTVEIRLLRDLGQHVRPRGEDFRAGDVLLQAGSAVTPAAVGVLASAGTATVAVHRRPVVALAGSGDELVPLEEFGRVRSGHAIVSSNSYTLRALLRQMGIEARDLGIARDSERAVRTLIRTARGCDLVVTTAGISVGERDHTRRVIESLGGTVEFWRARIRPGAPIAFGSVHGVPWIGLSGNPVSAMVTFELFVRPAILRMSGHHDVFPRPVTVTLEEPVSTGAPLMHFLRAVVTPRGEGYTARLTGTQSSAALTSMLRANALLVVPEDRRHCDAGDVLSAIPLGGWGMRQPEFPA